jgi:hypothetical protein
MDYPVQLQNALTQTSVPWRRTIHSSPASPPIGTGTRSSRQSKAAALQHAERPAVRPGDVGTERAQGNVTWKGGERGRRHAPAPDIPPDRQRAGPPFGPKNARPRVPCSRLLGRTGRRRCEQSDAPQVGHRRVAELVRTDLARWLRSLQAVSHLPGPRAPGPSDGSIAYGSLSPRQVPPLERWASGLTPRGSVVRGRGADLSSGRRHARPRIRCSRLLGRWLWVSHALHHSNDRRTVACGALVRGGLSVH